MIYDEHIKSCNKILASISAKDAIYRDIKDLELYYRDLKRFEKALHTLTPIICAEFNVTELELKSLGKVRRVADARNAYCYLMKEVVGAPPRVVARYLSRDRTSIYNAVLRAKWISETEAKYRLKVNACQKLFIQSIS